MTIVTLYLQASSSVHGAVRGRGCGQGIVIRLVDPAAVVFLIELGDEEFDRNSVPREARQVEDGLQPPVV